jgi:hypothetical protein
MQITSEQKLLDEALTYVYYYNNVREHSSLDYHTPFEALRAQLPDVAADIRCPPPFLLDAVSTAIGPWTGYHLLAPHRISRPPAARASPTGRAALPALSSLHLVRRLRRRS